jgi:hypothetical protein
MNPKSRNAFRLLPAVFRPPHKHGIVCIDVFQKSHVPLCEHFCLYGRQGLFVIVCVRTCCCLFVCVDMSFRLSVCFVVFLVFG